MCKSAFADCEKLRVVTFSPNTKLKRIGEWCFRETGLESFTFPSMVREVGEYAFAECEQLKDVWLNEGLEELGTYDGCASSDVFYSSGLQSVRFPSTLKTIRPCTFASCKGLKNVVLPPGLRKLDYRAFWGCGITKIFIPATVEEICEGVFMNCALTEVVFEENSRLKVVEDYAFGTYRDEVRIAPENVRIPEGVQVSKLAFAVDRW